MATHVDETGFPALSKAFLAEIPGTDYPLKRAVGMGGEIHTTLTMRDAVVDDSLWLQGIEATEKSPGVREVLIIARLCGVAPDIIRLLSLADYQVLQKAFTVFFTPSALTENGSRS